MEFDPDLISSFIREAFLDIPLQPIDPEKYDEYSNFTTRKDLADYFGDSFESMQESWARTDGTWNLEGWAHLKVDDYSEMMTKTGLCLTNKGLINGFTNIFVVSPTRTEHRCARHCCSCGAAVSTPPNAH